MRKALGGDYQPAKQGRTKIAGWQSISSSSNIFWNKAYQLLTDVYREIQDDGTAALGDLRSVNEGLGQTHRAKLMEDERIRTYTGEPDYRKGRHHNESSGYGSLCTTTTSLSTDPFPIVEKPLLMQIGRLLGE